ncbi:MAG: enoyl-CoA hydratase/isomerase family protein [Alphaproteobacteria bacterium]|nr:enoyl-CoA hydratase/isomerase family protein [Alphaproteobacteria bacterium]
MADFRHILFEVSEPGIVLVTLNRPKYLNAYTNPLCEELVRALHHYVEDDELRCLVLTGAGRGFCSGGDVSGEGDGPSYRHRQMGQAQEMRAGMHQVIKALHRMDKPVIAMINGPAVAGGLALALACDMRIACNTAKLGDTSGRFGLLPDEGGAWLFPRAMGLDRALKMTLLHEVYPAAEAMALGLVTEVVPEAELRTRTFVLARAIAGKAPLAVRLAKNMMRKSLDTSLENSLDDAALSVMIANPSEDVREGLRAFRERRVPQFKGR